MSAYRRGAAFSQRAVGALKRRGRAALSRGSSAPLTVPGALSEDEHAILEACLPYTMASAERLVANMDAAAHVVCNGIPGALVECGVWRGGSALAMIRTLQRLGVADREIYLYDTFEGMTQPTPVDTSRFQGSALVAWQRAQATGRRAWEQWFRPEVFDRDEVERLLRATGYPRERLHLVAGPVEETIPANAPSDIAVLRLDTDWYQSTLHELEHLYPLLQSGGVLIVDDYGHWEGARLAVDEYFDRHGQRPLLARTDYTGRLAVKPG